MLEVCTKLLIQHFKVITYSAKFQINTIITDCIRIFQHSGDNKFRWQQQFVYKYAPTNNASLFLEQQGCWDSVLTPWVSEMVKQAKEWGGGRVGKFGYE